MGILTLESDRQNRSAGRAGQAECGASARSDERSEVDLVGAKRPPGGYFIILTLLSESASQ